VTTLRTPVRALACATGAFIACAAPAAALSPGRRAQRPPAGPSTWPPAASLRSSLSRSMRSYRVALTHARHRSRHAHLTARGHAVAPAGAPAAVRELVRAANRISHLPYVWGGGHGAWRAAGYDCSGSVGYALHGAHLLARPTTSGSLAGYGRPGPGRWITIYANAGHVYMVVAGLRFDTSARSLAGSRWTRVQRVPAGYQARHPARL